VGNEGLGVDDERSEPKDLQQDRPVAAAERAVQEVAADFTFQGSDAPIADVLEEQQAQHHFSRGARSAMSTAAWVTRLQRPIDDLQQVLVDKDGIVMMQDNYQILDAPHQCSAGSTKR
jgi:hypothetical protein